MKPQVQNTAKQPQQDNVRVITAIDEVSASAWNAIADASSGCLSYSPSASTSNSTYPFTRHEFLSALESTGCASEYSGWEPQHVICTNGDGELTGALPMYLKTNSYGEFVFDFSWASAYHQAGLEYYPKLVCAIPYTPATGPRILTESAADSSARIKRALINAATEHATENGYSSFHALMANRTDIKLMERMGLLLRKDCQFHWRNQAYKNFDDFLATFTASKRKKVRRERRRMNEHNIVFDVRDGGSLTESDWHAIMPLYRHTFLRRGREPYLGLEFFLEIAQRMPESLVVFLGKTAEKLVSVAICFRSDTALYGRYWGATEYLDSLHFETCYYQGIEYCIENGLKLFEPGTQGEHKISRGFVPTETWSAHWLAHPRFASAVNDFLGRERDYIDEYIGAASQHTPYRRHDN